VKCFETFKTDLRSNGSNDTSEDSVEFDILKEIKLLEEVKDIRDELNIVKSIFEEQKALLTKLLTVITDPKLGGSGTVQSDPVLNYYQERSDINLRIEKVKKMEVDITTTYDAVR
jgi:hypothetical protein